MTDSSNVVPFAASEGEQEAEAREVRSPHLLEAKRMVEAIIFASAEPVPERILAERLPDGTDVTEALKELQGDYEKRGVNLVRVENSWAFRTASDLSFLLNRNAVQQRKLSRAALEMLAVIAYHQPVTRAEIEENDFNLNIPRYVDTFEEEDEIDLLAVRAERMKLKDDLAELETRMAGYLREIGYGS